jgi:hypothetical protein
MNGDSVYSAVSQFGIGGTGELAGTGYMEGVTDPFVGMLALGIIGDNHKGIVFFDETGLFEAFYMEEICQPGGSNNVIGV